MPDPFFCECREYETEQQARYEYAWLAGRIMARKQREPGLSGSAFLMCDADSARAFVAVIGDDRDALAEEIKLMDGEPFKLPREHVDRMRNRRTLVNEAVPGESIAAFRYAEPSALQDDGRIGRF